MGEGAAHAVYKVIEGERASAAAQRRRGEEEDLRECLCLEPASISMVLADQAAAYQA